MENYILNQNTIAVLKQKNKTIIFDVENIRVINKNIKRVIRDNCLLYGSTSDGRIKSAKNLINSHYKLPIIINSNIILIGLNSIRKDTCLFLVLNKIINYKYINDYLKIKCNGNYIFNYNI